MITLIKQHPYRTLGLIVALVVMGFAAWGQSSGRKLGTQQILSVADIPSLGAAESQQIVCRGSDPCVWIPEGQPVDGSSGWTFADDDTCGTDIPASGTWSVDGTAADYSDVTKICFSKTTTSAADATESLSSYEKGSSIYIQEFTDRTRNGVTVTTANPTIFATHVEYAVTAGIAGASLTRVVQDFVLQFVRFEHSNINVDIRDAFLTALTAGGADEQIIEWDTSTTPDEFKFIDPPTKATCSLAHITNVISMGYTTVVFSHDVDTTISSVRGICEGAGMATAVMDIEACDSASINCSVVGTLSCDVDGDADSTISGAPFDADDWLRITVTSTSGGVVNKAAIVVCHDPVS